MPIGTGLPAPEDLEDEYAGWHNGNFVRTFKEVARVERAGVLVRIRARIQEPSAWEEASGHRLLSHTRVLGVGQSIEFKLPISDALLPARVLQAGQVSEVEVDYLIHLTRHGDVRLQNEKYDTFLHGDAAFPVPLYLTLSVDPDAPAKTAATVELESSPHESAKWRVVDAGNGQVNLENKFYQGFRLNMRSVKGKQVPSAGEGKKGKYQT